MSETLTDPSFPHKECNCSTAQMQEFNDVREFLKIYRNKYNSYKILHGAVEDILSDASLDSELKLKVQDIVLGPSCAQVVGLESEGFGESSNTLLGLTDLINSVLSYDDSLKVKKAVMSVLESKYEHICETFSKTFDENVNTAPSSGNFGDLNLSASDHVLFEFKSKLEEQQRRYLQKLLEEQKLLERMVNLRLEKLPIVCESKVTEYQIKSQMAALRSKLVQEKARVDIFMGKSNSLSAYKELMNDIKLQQEECQRDIQYLEKLKEQYAQVACKQYNDMLKSYIQYKASLEKKKMIYDSLYC